MRQRKNAIRMFEFLTDIEEYKAELSELIRQFDAYDPSGNISVHLTTVADDLRNVKICVNGQENAFHNDAPVPTDKLGFRKATVRFLKNSLYLALRSALKRDLPWGALTGVRPSRLAYELLSSGVEIENLPAELNKTFYIARDKAELLGDIVANQAGYYTTDKDYVNFYVHIPLCPSRCKYCSFVSASIDKQKKLVEPYIEALRREIEHATELIRQMNKKVLSVYIGGGTPTVLSAQELEKILSAIPYRDIEYTCECGRPETITEEKLAVLVRHGVNRISVNPQTLFDETLANIGRNHTAADFFTAYNAARKFDFTVNVDLIAGLPSETPQMFSYTLDKITDLRPENITVHTLSKKRGSVFAETGTEAADFGTEEMMNYAHCKLKEDGYRPYYLYRQKQMTGNLENAGYALDGKQSVNNITTMEECVSVIACGAGAISKVVIEQSGSGSRIERLAGIKDIKQYIEEFDERLNKKEIFVKNSLQ